MTVSKASVKTFYSRFFRDNLVDLESVSEPLNNKHLSPLLVLTFIHETPDVPEEVIYWKIEP